jgi:hypothetical protein
MLTCQQIVSLATQIAKAPGFTSQAGQFLNHVLNDLVLHRDLKINRVTTSVVAQAGSNGPFALASSYLRTYDLFFTLNGMPYFLTPASQEQFDAEFKDPSVANYPYEFATDLSPQALQQPGLLYIYPQSTSQLTLTHRYMVNRSDIHAPELSQAIPWFPDQDYLVKATALRLMDITDDDRRDKFKVDAEDMLRTHLIMEGDEQRVVKEVRLDPRRFRSTRGMRSTKATG